MALVLPVAVLLFTCRVEITSRTPSVSMATSMALLISSVDETAPASGALVYDLWRKIGAPLSMAAAVGVFVSLVTDTGFEVLTVSAGSPPPPA